MSWSSEPFCGILKEEQSDAVQWRLPLLCPLGVGGIALGSGMIDTCDVLFIIHFGYSLLRYPFSLSDDRIYMYILQILNI